MPLTPEDVSNKRFTAVRLREGYDMGEVDQFLDEVEAELARLTTENEELRAKLESMGDQTAPAPAAEQESAEESQSKDEPKDEPEGQPEEQPKQEDEKPAEPEAPPVEPVAEARHDAEVIQVTTTDDASRAATRLLELAGRNADSLITDAQEQADRILGEARERAEALDAETAERRNRFMGDLEGERQELDREVNRLREFEQTYRAELKDYFHRQLEALERDSGDQEAGDRDAGGEKSDEGDDQG